MAEYRDRHGNTWDVGMEPPDPMPIHQGIATDHWRVTITAPDGASVEHGHQNLAQAVAEAVAKADWLRR